MGAAAGAGAAAGTPPPGGHSARRQPYAGWPAAAGPHPAAGAAPWPAVRGCYYSTNDTDKCCCHHLFWRINQKSNAHKSFVSFIIYTGNISWNPVLSEHSLLDKPIKERAAVFYCRPLVTYKDWVFSLILLLYPMILTTKEILKILIINLSSNLTYDILFSHLPSRKHYCHYCNHYIQHHNSIQNQIRNISSIM